MPKEDPDNSLSFRLREVFGKNAYWENEVTSTKLASSKIGIFAEKIRKPVKWSYPGFP